MSIIVYNVKIVNVVKNVAKQKIFYNGKIKNQINIIKQKNVNNVKNVKNVKIKEVYYVFNVETVNVLKIYVKNIMLNHFIMIQDKKVLIFINLKKKI